MPMRTQDQASVSSPALKNREQWYLRLQVLSLVSCCGSKCADSCVQGNKRPGPTIVSLMPQINRHASE